MAGDTRYRTMEIALLTALALVLVACAWLLRERWRLQAETKLALGRPGDLEQARASFQALAG